MGHSGAARIFAAERQADWRVFSPCARQSMSSTRRARDAAFVLFKLSKIDKLPKQV
jgi:hypothetical protein